MLLLAAVLCAATALASAACPGPLSTTCSPTPSLDLAQTDRPAFCTASWALYSCADANDCLADQVFSSFWSVAAPLCPAQDGSVAIEASGKDLHLHAPNGAIMFKSEAAETSFAQLKAAADLANKIAACNREKKLYNSDSDSCDDILTSLMERVDKIEQCGGNKQFSDGSDTCLNSPAVLPVVDPSDPPCDSSTAGRLRRLGDEGITICNGQRETRYFPAPLGSAKHPAASCGEILSAGLENGKYYVGNGQVLCVNGDAIVLPPFEVLGQPRLYLPLDGTVTDHSLRPEAMFDEVVGGNASFTNGVRGSAMSFDGNVFLKLAGFAAVWDGPFTASFWVLLSDVNSLADWVVFSHGDAEEQSGLHLNVRKVGGVYVPHMGYYAADLSGSSTWPVTGAVWQHVVFTTNGVNSRQVYLNGDLVANSGATVAYKAQSGDTYLGHSSYLSGAVPLKGALDEVIVWDRHMSTTDVGNLFQSYLNEWSLTTTACDEPQVVALGGHLYNFPSGQTLCANGLTFKNLKAPYAYFNFDGHMDDLLYGRDPESSSGGITYEDSRPGLNKALRVNAGSVYWSYDTIYTDFWQNAFSLAFWVKFVKLNSGDNTIMVHGDWGQASSALHIVERGTKLRIGMYGNDLESPMVLSADTWYHVVVTYSPSSTCTWCNAGKAGQRIFIDGNPSGQRDATDYKGQTQKTRIGQNYDNNASRNFNGFLDEMIFFAAELSPVEAKALYDMYQ